MKKSLYVDDEAVNCINRLYSSTTHNPNKYRKFSLSVIEALARACDTDPTEESLHLQGVIHEATLDSLLWDSSDDVELHGAYIWFCYRNFGVFCCNCGRISIYKLNECPEGEPIHLPFENPHPD